MKRPIGISIISYFYIWGAFILFITSIFYESHVNEIGISDRFIWFNSRTRTINESGCCLYNINYHLWIYEIKKMGILVNDCVFYSFWDYKSSADINL
ncbi:hypothetical protein M3589_07205 [Heyndrickxia oleronia]|uniref:hypothetical protein n=1 Tax=Heyndrickxia oleronia TaxID=38875 RepID=UPI00203B1F9F|nr:hypothetical protein [Heyndrickxia oleronia]MCM3237510.1 hypothetical protein [Heyndrickxia oleronia]